MGWRGSKQAVGGAVNKLLEDENEMAEW